jgi:hypothetical protein
MRTTLSTAMACFWVLSLAATAQAAPFTKEVQKACATDYRKYCGEYGLETAALRTCMDKAGQKLTHACVHALIRSGEVSSDEVERRKRSGK